MKRIFSETFEWVTTHCITSYYLYEALPVYYFIYDKLSNKFPHKYWKEEETVDRTSPSACNAPTPRFT